MKRLLVVLCTALWSLVACGGASGTPTEQPATPAAATSEGEVSAAQAAPLSGALRVYAAASLQQTFTEIGDALMAEHPDLEIEFVFAGSSDLVAQLAAGAPGDVFASADERNMTKAVDEALLNGEPQPFVTNLLTIITAPGNPLGITGLADLTNPETQVVVCAPQVPCGGATQQVSELAGVTLTPVSEETSVTNVLAKVTSGEADAGLVYRTDARNAGDKVSALDFPEADQVTNYYPIATLAESTNPEAAASFVDLVRSPTGQEILADAGFNVVEG